MEQRQLQPVQDRPHVASRLGCAPTLVGLGDSGPGRDERVGVDVVGAASRHNGDLAQSVPLRRGVLGGRVESAGRGNEPAIHLGEVLSGTEPES